MELRHQHLAEKWSYSTFFPSAHRWPSRVLEIRGPACLTQPPGRNLHLLRGGEVQGVDDWMTVIWMICKGGEAATRVTR
jgi:hypothetical protein